MREMGKNRNTIVVLRIVLKFWCMIAMGVIDNHTRYEPETQQWRTGTGVANGRLICHLGPKTAYFGPNALKPI